MSWNWTQGLKGLWPAGLGDIGDHFDVHALVHNPYVIALACLVVAFALYKRMVRLLALIFCGSAFYFASTTYIPSGGSTLNPGDTLSFLAICILIIIVAIYFFFLRSD